MSGISKINGEYSVSYSNMAGADFRTDGGEIDRHRFAYLENMYRDYERAESHVIESVPGFRSVLNLGSRIHAVYSQKCGSGDEYILVHAGTGLYRFNVEKRDSFMSLSPIATLTDFGSHGFAYGGYFFVIDDESITRIAEDGTVEKVSSSNLAYVPTTFKDLEPYEQRNLLTTKFYETLTITDRRKFERASDGLIFEADYSSGKCTLVGIDGESEGVIFIPAYTNLGGREYEVDEIGDDAFASNTKIVTVKIAEGIKKIGHAAFCGCTSLKEVVTPDSIYEIGGLAFSGCGQLSSIYLGRGLGFIGEDAFSECSEELGLKFGALKSTVLNRMESDAAFANKNASFGNEKSAESFRIPVKSPAESIYLFKIDGVSQEYTLQRDVRGLVCAILFSKESTWTPEGSEITIGGNLSKSVGIDYEDAEEFCARSGGVSGIYGCKVSTVFDGRIFLAGNPSFPNTVFYSLTGKGTGADELYFGALAYFDDGVAAFNTVGLAALSDALVVLKEGDDGGGAIFCHKPTKTDDFREKVYPVSNIHTGISSKGGALSFLDEVIFLSSTGLCALGCAELGNYYTASRSTNVNPKLLTHELNGAKIVEWLGYLVVCADSSLYLADTRDTFVGPLGKREYEWYVINGVGTYSSARARFKYADTAPPGYAVSENAGKHAYGTIVYSGYTEGYGSVYYTEEDGVRYTVYPTGESEGGTFSPASAILASGRLLFFGTESGEVCVFNNDKRGTAPPHLTAREGFNAEEYERTMGNKIHPYFYDFASRAPRYAIKTKLDNCGVAHLAKSTLKNSLVIKMRNTGGTMLCEVVTDRGKESSLGKVACGVFDFKEMDFGVLSFETSESVSIGVCENSKAWVEKQICIYSEEFRSPIAISSLAYRYKIRGKIQRR